MKELVRNNTALLFLTILTIVLLLLSAAWFSLAASIIDDTSGEFNSGSFNNTQFDTGNSWVELNGVGQVSGIGDYTSQIFDATADSNWNSVAWVPDKPAGKPLPNNDGVETAYGDGNVDMSNNLLLYHVDETSGSVIDSSGSGFNASVNGAALGADGVVGKAIDVTGNGDLIENQSISLSFGSEITLMAWFRYTGAGTGSPRILELSANGDYASHALAPDADGSIRAWAQCDNGTRVGSVDDGTQYNDGEWHHFVYTYSSPTARVYIDGVQTGAATGACANLDDVTDVSIGAISDKSGLYTHNQHEFDGYIDEVAVFDYELSASQISDIYQRGAMNLRFQVRSCDDIACVGEDFIGPDGTSGTYYEWNSDNAITTPSFNLTNVSQNQYFQYKVFFLTNDVTLTPEIKSVTVDYSIANSNPDTPNNLSPSNGVSGQSKNPILEASIFFDVDSDGHSDSEWIVDDNSDFSSPVWTRTAGNGEELIAITTSNGSFSNELAGHTSLLSEATYYWKVRYQDSFGNWSSYSTPTSFKTLETVSGASTAFELLPPSTPSIVIEKNENCVSSKKVTITLSASNATEVIVSNKQSLVDGEWETLSTHLEKEWVLAGDEGSQLVYAIFRSPFGVSSTVVADSIVVDSTCDHLGRIEKTEEIEPIIPEPIIPEVPEVFEPPVPLPPKCQFGCDKDEYVFYIINPDGTRIDSKSKFTDVSLRSNYQEISFEDKGEDTDQDDLVLQVKTQACPHISVQIVKLMASWDHKVGMEIRRNNIVVSDIILFESSQKAFRTLPHKEILLNDMPFACEERPKSFSKQHIEVFSQTNFAGNSEIIEIGEDEDLSDNSILSDTIRSVRLTGGVIVELFSDVFFGGVVERIFIDDPDLSNNVIGMDTVSSIRVMPFVSETQKAVIEVVENNESKKEDHELIKISCRPKIPLTLYLTLGVSGLEVESLQNTLRCLGYFPSSIESTGYFGLLTQKAVIQFQIENEILSSGTVGPITRQVINKN